ncbi:hypothetical protein BGW41_003107 [Actinomortierella wolfii]|nr:hypothetical protein BGW41_003107 [Actinomortierella wolfii]
MAGTAPTIKELYKAIGVDFARHISTAEDPPREPVQGESIQQMMDKFVRSQVAATLTSMPVPSGLNSTGGLTSSASSPSGRGTATSSSNPITPRFANELWYQSLASPVPTSQLYSQSHKLPFAFHRMSQHSSVATSPDPLASVSQAPSNVSSPILSAITNAGSVGAGLGLGVSSSSPATPSSSSFPTASSFSTAALAPHRLSAHLISLYQQGGPGVPLAKAASRIILYLTHMMPYLTPRLVMYDWWDRLFEPAFQGEIKLEKASLRACRELVVACMTKDQLVDGSGMGTGSMLTAGDEEGQLDNHLVMTAMAIPQLVVRKYLLAAFKLNHQLADSENDGSSRMPGSVTWLQSRNILGYSHQDASMPPQIQEQYKAYAKTKMALRRKRDLLVHNLERVLVAYGSNVGRVKDFFRCLYTYFVGIKFRAEVLVLLNRFVRRQYDTSPLIVSLGLTALIMLMPRIPTALNDKLPDLFNILARIINWPKPNQQQLAVFVTHPGKEEDPSESFNEFEDCVPNPKASASRRSSLKESGQSVYTEIEYEEISLFDQGIRWLRHGPIRPKGEPGPDPVAFFTFLYGLFPCNLIKFLHSPRKYISQSMTALEGSSSRALSPGRLPEEVEGSPTLSSAGVGQTSITAVMSPKEGLEEQPPPSYIDEDLLKSRVQPLLKRHSVHPNLLTSDAEKEINDMIRWQKLEPMEIVAMCVSLDTWSAAGPNGLGPSLKSIDDDLYSDESESSSEDGTAEDSTSTTGRPISTNESGRLNPDTETPPSLGHKESTSDADDAEITPLEELTAQEFFGPHARAQSARGTSSAAFARHARSISGTDSRGLGGQLPSLHQETFTGVGASTSLTRPHIGHSRGVRMSRILRNFVALRGLQDNELASSFAHLQFASTRQSRVHSVSGSGSAPDSRPVSGVSDTASHEASTSMESTPISSANQSRRNSNHGHPQLQVLPPTISTEILLKDYQRTILQLERELMMAMNELNFELFLKQQHIQQISKIHRSHVMDASVEAERQNLYNTCRSLKAQLVETKLLLDKEKAEMNQRKNKQVHWDTDLKSKLQSFREERKQLNAELDRLKVELEDTRRQQQIQERLLTDERKSTFQLGNSMASLQPRLKKLELYEQQIEEMSQQLLVWENEQAKSLEIQRQAEIMFTKWQSMEMLLAAEKEETRQLRNRISQQSQILDDMRIQMAIQSTGEHAHKAPEVEQSIAHSRSHRHRHSLASVVEGQEDTEEGDTDNDVEEGLEHNSAAHINRRKESHDNDMPWIALQRSNSNQAGTLDRRKSEAIQQFLWKEKERWDMELHQAHNRLAAEALKNQQLEDTIMDLRGQLEMALAMNRRSVHYGQRVDRAGYDGGTSGYNTSVYDDETEHSEADPRGLIGPPSKAQDVPYPNKEANYRGRAGADDSDEGTGILGRYMSQHRKQQQLELQQKQDQTGQAQDDQDAEAVTDPPRSGKKGKNKDTKEKKKSRTRWLQPPALLERAHTDTSVYNQQNPSGKKESLSSSEAKAKRKSGAGSSAVAARATSGGFFTPSMHFHREGGSAVPVVSVIAATPGKAAARDGLRGGGPSDVSLQSNSSTGDDRESYSTSSTRGRRGRIASHGSSEVGIISEEDEEGLGDDGNDSNAGDRSRLSRSSSTQPNPQSQSRASSPGVSSTATSTTTTSTRSPLSPTREERAREKQRERSLERARERERLINGGSSLTDPRKLYRNVRMF